MSANPDSIKNNSVFSLEQKFQQLLSECKSHELTMKTNEDNLNNCLKRNVLLEHELKTERLNKSMRKIKLDALTITLSKLNNINNDNNSGPNVNVMTNDSEYLSNKIFNIKAENMELKQKLAKSKSEILQVIENQQKYSEKADTAISMFNSLKQEVKKLEKQSHILIQILGISKILARKMLNALEYYNKLKASQFDRIQGLMKDVAIINSKIYTLLNQNEKNQMIQIEEENTIAIQQTHMTISNKLIEILQIENNKLHNNICQMLNKSTDISVDKFQCKYNK